MNNALCEKGLATRGPPMQTKLTHLTGYSLTRMKTAWTEWLHLEVDGRFEYNLCTLKTDYITADYITKYKTNPRLLNRTTNRTSVFGELWNLLEQYNACDIGIYV